MMEPSVGSDSPIGRLLGPYRIVAPLGAGGMGEVYRAEDTRLGRSVAVKLLAEGSVSDARASARFQREARAASALSHPHICTLHDVGESDGRPFLVMELLAGETLAARIARGPIPPGELVEWAIQITDGLAAAHSLGILHRDLKPANLFVTAQGGIKILDFGLAKHCPAPDAATALRGEGDLSSTHLGATVGTAAYMSPEQARGEELDARSDLFSLGAVLYEMATGRQAFTGGTAALLFDAILNRSPRPIGEAPPGVPLELAAIVERLLEKERTRRYPGAVDLLADLRRLSPSSSRRPVGTETRATDGGSAAAVRRPAGSERARRGLLLGAAVGAVLLVVLAMTFTGDSSRSAARPDPASIRSLAVLPLDNLSGDPGQEHFAEGMTEAIITNLAQVSDLRVISRTSSAQYKDAGKPLPEIARELGVEALVEGSVQRADDRVQVTAQLIHAASDTHLWSRSYEAELRDVLTLQNDVARAIAAEIRVELTPEEQTRLTEARRVDPEAHEAYSKGLHHFFRVNLEDFDKAARYFQRATEIDPTYAPAYAQLGILYDTLAVFGGMAPKEAVGLARAAIDRALELDDELADAHLASALVRRDLDWDFAGSEREFRRTLALNPGHAWARDMYGVLLVFLRRYEEAEAELERARELDPLSLDINNNLGYVYYARRDFDRSIEQYEKTLDLDPNFVMAHRELGVVLSQARRFDESVIELERARTLSPDPYTLASLGYAYGIAGRRNEARRILGGLEELSATSYVSGYHLAYVHLGLGEEDEALRQLERAFDERQPLVAYLAFEPSWDPLRADPRFQSLLQRVGLAG